ncbi:MAG TPA: rod shape-determining protein MreC [bacterium]|jgi:rod shape-determining protein MreC
MYSRRRIHPAALVSGIAILIILLVLIAGKLDFLGWMVRGLSSMTLSSNRIPDSPEEMAGLRDRVGELEGENTILRERILAYQEYEKLMDVAASLQQEIVPAKIIFRDHAHLFSSAIINRGSSDGLKVNMPVVDSGGVIGRVVSVRSAVSRIELITNPDCAFGVLDQRSREIGIVRGIEPFTIANAGSGNGSGSSGLLELVYLSPSADISVQDTLITSGLSGITPPGLRIGEVIEIISVEEEGRYEIKVRPFADVEHVEIVGIVLYEGEDPGEMSDLLEEVDISAGVP